MTDFTHVIVDRPEEFVRVHEVVRDQEFKVSELRHDAAKGFVDILFARRFPPHKGLWLVRIPWVRSWRVDHAKLHDRETLKEIRWDEKARTVTLRCVTDEYVAVVERLDVRLGRLDEDDPAKVKYDDLPEWFKEEVRQQDAAREAEVERSRASGRKVRMRGAIWASIFTFLAGALGGGNLLVLLLAAPAFSGGSAFYLLGTNLDPRVFGPIWGCLSLFAVVAAGVGNPVAVLFGALMFVCAGVWIGIWIRDEERMWS